MKTKDIIFAIVSGLLVAWLAVDFLGKIGFIFFIIFPIMSVAGLWFCDWLGKKYPFIRQSGRFFLVGSFADVIDIKIFQFLFWIAPFSLFFKGISFLVATIVKYWWNKNWAFEKNGNDSIKKEILQFFSITLIGLGINIVSFYFFSKINIRLPNHLWQEICIILAALVSATWNFLGYKFLVFTKPKIMTDN